MDNIYKRCEAWVTDLQSDLFAWARVKLTALYLLAVVVILAVFSVVLYASLSHRLHSDFGNQPTMVNGSVENVAEEALERIDAALITSDIVILLIAGTFSYWLAGYTLRPIRKALDAQSSFSAEASHELRTPLAVMRTGIEVLLRSSHALPKEATEVLQNNLEEIASMSAMTEHLLALSRGQSTGAENFTRLNLGDLVRDVARKLEALALKKQVSLSFGSVADVYVSGNQGGLERVLQNVITNALAHTPREGSVQVSVIDQQHAAKVCVVDTGIGIPAKDLPRIFDVFYKADQARTVVSGQSGAGLGLAIVKKIVEQHRGTVEAESAVGKGTTVTVLIPKA